VDSKLSIRQFRNCLPHNSALPLLAERPREFIKIYRWSPVALVLGASADLFTTLWNLRLYGVRVEVHVVQRWLSQLIGIEAGVPLAKFGQLACVIFVAAWWRPWCRWILLICSVVYALAAVCNYFMLF
jgi:hypothetical protein